MKMIFATRDTDSLTGKVRPVIHMVESLEPGKAGDAVLVWQGLDWRTAEGDTNLDLLLKICAELWSVYTTLDQIAYVKRALSNANGWTVSDDCRDWQPPTPPAEWVEHEQEQRYPDEAEAAVPDTGYYAVVGSEVEPDCTITTTADKPDIYDFSGRIQWLESEYLKLARLVVDWYTAPPDDGFSPETQALQDKARWLSETPESAWL